MTTQNTHFESGDADTGVVENSSTPESAVDPTNAETMPSAEAEVQAGISSSEPVPPTIDQEEGQHQAPMSAMEEPGKTLSLSKEEEEVRPFTDFIEEFRQAEARLNASVQKSEGEVFTLFPEVETSASGKKAAQATPAFDFKVAASLEQAIEISGEAGTKAAGSPKNVNKVVEGKTVGEAIVGEAVAAAIEPEKAKEADKDTEKKAPVERAVSPLLRPASRLRIPRHGGMRHQQRDVPAAGAPEQGELKADTAVTPTLTGSVEQAAEPEKPRPARRYRFDRPASTTQVPVTPAPQPSVESTASTSEQVVETPTKTAEHAISGATEQQAAKKLAVQEAVTTEHATPTVVPAQEQGRRRSHERHKEQPAAASTPMEPVAVTEIAVPTTEVSKQSEEIAPEDLPPLEYAELQKASSRRRRRHRPATGTGVVAAPAPVTRAVTPPLVAPTAPTVAVVPPRPANTNTPTAPAAAAPTQFTIVSGYTVNQMNQGGEATGPFMAPEPSPAKGSVMIRDGRTTRAETLRTPSPTYPTRSHESGLSSVSMTQFANVVSQAIQTQTDRMITELRRANQAPTNVTVSLPPFPSTERVGVFVDVANLLYSARTLRMAVDFGKLLDFLRGNRRLVRAQAYCPTSPQPGDEQMFLQAVKGLGYRITTKNYKTFSSGAKKADLDLDLCMDVVRLVDGRAVDCVVLVSGDSDFMPMLDYCSDHGVRVEVAAFDEAMSATLRQSCDLFINLSMLEDIRA